MDHVVQQPLTLRASRRRPVPLSMLRAETRLYLRDTPSAVFALLIPAVVLVAWAAVLHPLAAKTFRWS